MMCDNTAHCQSFIYEPNRKKCYLYDKKIHGDEDQKVEWNMYTVFQDDCSKYDEFELL